MTVGDYFLLGSCPANALCDKLIATMSDRLEEELKGLLKRVSSAKLPHLTSDDVRLLANGLLPTSIRSARSLAFLCLSKYCQAVLKDEKSDEEKTDFIFSNFKPFLESCFAEHDEAEPELFIPFTTLPAALFPLAPLPAVRLVTTPLDASSDPSPDALSVLLEAAELPSPLQPALAELLAQASGTKPGRELVRSRAIEWLRGAVEFGDKSELGTLCAVALSKLGREESLPGSDQRAGVDPEESDEEALCQKMMAFVMSRPSSNSALLPTLEGLSILSVRPRIQEVLARSPSFLASLLALAPSIAARGGSLPVTPRGSMDVDDKLFEPVETSVCYGVTTILVNLTSRKPPMSAEDQQIAKLRTVAISGKKGPVRTEEDPLESEEAVKQRVKCVLKTDCVSALRGLARAESRLVKEGLGRLCLNLVEDKGDRPAFVREGGAKVLSGVVRDLTVGSATSKDSSIPNDTIVTLPAAQALAKLVITIPPHLLFPPPHLTTSFNALTPLYTLLIHPSSTPLQAFESLMALTNLASIDPSIASRIVEATVAPPHTESVWQSSGRDDKVKVIGKVEELMLDDNNMIRRAATELVCNLASSPAGFNYVTGHMAGGSSARVKSRLNILLVLTDVDDLPTRLAAGGALAILTQSKSACGALLSEAYDGSTPKRTVWSRSLRMLDPEDAAHELDEDNEAIPAISSTPPNPELVHRAVITLLNLFTYASSLDENRRSTEFATARKAGMEDKLLEVLRSGAGEEVLQPTVECLKLLQKYPAGS